MINMTTSEIIGKEKYLKGNVEMAAHNLATSMKEGVDEQVSLWLHEFIKFEKAYYEFLEKDFYF